MVAFPLEDLRRMVEAPARCAASFITFGEPALDRALKGGLAREALHEIYAARAADVAAAIGFAVGVAVRAAQERRVLWIRHDALAVEAGHLHAPGLAELGLDPALVVLVQARQVSDLLQAGAQAARCNGLGLVLIESWGEARAFDMTASRRLSLLAQSSGVPILALRIAARPVASAAWTRWLVGALPSCPLAADAPGHPAYELTLLRHREGVAMQTWRVEWDHDEGRFCERPVRAGKALHRPVVPVPFDRPVPADVALRRAG